MRISGDMMLRKKCPQKAVVLKATHSYAFELKGPRFSFVLH